MKRLICTFLTITLAASASATRLELHLRSRAETAKWFGQVRSCLDNRALGPAQDGRGYLRHVGSPLEQGSRSTGCGNGPADEPCRVEAPRPGRTDRPLPRRDDALLRGSPARKVAQAAPPAKPLIRRKPAFPEGPFPSTTPTAVVPTNSLARGPGLDAGNRQIEIKPVDGISDKGDEVYNLMRQKGVENVIVMGVHTNMCVLNRPYAIRPLVNQGMDVALVWDLTDTMYNPADAAQGGPLCGHGFGDRVHREVLVPVVHQRPDSGGTPFRFAADKR